MSIKVICIDASPGKDFAPPFKEGDTLTANEPPAWYILEGLMIGYNTPSYIIEEHPYGPYGRLCGWAKSRFAPISEIDETEFERNYQKELV